MQTTKRTGVRSNNQRRKGRKRNRNRTRTKGQAQKSRSGIGENVGAAIGNWAESGLRSLFGSGDYAEEFEHAGGFDVEENSIVKPTSAANVPLLNTPDVSKDGQLRVKHREYLGDISTGTPADPGGAVNGIYPLCPQDQRTFPWLSTIAGNFEQWIPHGIVFEFVSTCGNAVSSTNAALGSVSIATQYNIYSENFQDKSQLLNHYFAVSCKTADNLMHAVECNPEEVQVPIFNTFANATAFPTNGDDRLYYLGGTTVWRQGSQATYTAGELWITYDISLCKPRILRPPPVLSSNLAQVMNYLRIHEVATVTSEIQEELRAARLEEQEEKEVLEEITRSRYPHLARLGGEVSDTESALSAITSSSSAEAKAAARWIDLQHVRRGIA